MGWVRCNVQCDNQVMMMTKISFFDEKTKKTKFTKYKLNTFFYTKIQSSLLKRAIENITTFVLFLHHHYFFFIE